MKKILIALTLSLIIIACQSTSQHKNKQLSFAEPPEYETYEEAVANWTSYKDVAGWMYHNFRFNIGRVGSAVVTTPERLYKKKSGHCIDAANFITQTLNKINPTYKAKSIFIQNSSHGVPHWVTYFKTDEGKFVMDYGAGPRWSSMIGLHGPLKNLGEYQNFLESLSINDFRFKSAEFREPEDWLSVD